MNLFCKSILVFALGVGNALAGLEGVSNTFYGMSAGTNTTGDDDNDTFMGAYAGYSNTSGSHNTFLGGSAGLSNTTGSYNTFLGRSAGYYNINGHYNTFVGGKAGHANTSGAMNTFVGENAGGYSTTGVNNTFLGASAGSGNTTGTYNTYIGGSAGLGNNIGFNNTFVGMWTGAFTSGHNNVFLGGSAGQNETGSNRLYIANSSTTTPLIYGEFDNKKIILNGNLEVVGPDFGIIELTDNKTNNATKAARLVLSHYTNVQEPVYLVGAASTPSQNFVAFGGGNAIGNAATQLDFFTALNNTTPAGTPRMTITGGGNVGIGTQSPVHPLHMASGALVTSGGVWTNASSRDYKENIKDLSSNEASLTLASLTPVTYNYKVDKTQAHVGFIAEDVPDLVATKDRKGLSPMDIVAVLTKVVKEQQKMNEEQQAVIAELSIELKALKREVRLNGTMGELE